MKFSVITYLIITTIILVVVILLAAYNVPFYIVFFTTLLGIALLIFSVIKVLTDNYSTEKTFDDFYEDHPIGRESRKITRESQKKEPPNDN